MRQLSVSAVAIPRYGSGALSAAEIDESTIAEVVCNREIIVVNLSCNNNLRHLVAGTVANNIPNGTRKIAWLEIIHDYLS